MKQALCFDENIIGPWVLMMCGGRWIPGMGRAIGKIKNGEIVAGVVYEDWNGANLTCHIAGVGQWADRNFLAIIFDYPFNQIGAKRITAPICSSNTKSIDLVRKMGFNQENKLQGATPKGDLLLFSMFKNECKYLRGKYGKIIERTSCA